MALIHHGASEDLPEKLAERAALSLVGFNVMFWGYCGSGWISGGAGVCLGGVIVENHGFYF